jgi:hypothetical protein
MRIWLLVKPPYRGVAARRDSLDERLSLYKRKTRLVSGSSELKYKIQNLEFVGSNIVGGSLEPWA